MNKKSGVLFFLGYLIWMVQLIGGFGMLAFAYSWLPDLVGVRFDSLNRPIAWILRPRWVFWAGMILSFVNFCFGLLIQWLGLKKPALHRVLLALAVVFNLAALSYIWVLLLRNGINLLAFASGESG